MNITLTPQRRDTPLILSKVGDVLTLNGESFDLSGIPEGATLPGEAIESDWFAGDVSRVEGALNLTLIVPHGQNAPRETRFPEVIVGAKDGVIELPPFEIAPEPGADPDLGPDPSSDPEPEAEPAA